MKGAKELYEILRKIASPGDGFFPAMVKAVAADGTCTVMADETEYYDVRLQPATGNNLTGVLNTPAINSVVMLQRIGSSNEFAIVMFSMLDECKTTIGTNTITHDATGFELKGGADTLGKIVGDLLTQLQSLTCNVTAVGAPTGVPINSAAFAAIKTRLDAFIK